jgi:hypothetical protein
VAALPVIAAGYKQNWNRFFEVPGARPTFAMGEDFMEANGVRALWLFTIARWACLPFSVIGGLFCFLWARELWSHNGAGLIALTLWCFEPNILAHGELITPDCAAASLGLGAGYLFWRWLRRPTWARALAAGLLLGLAELAKMTWIVLFALWPLLWLFWMWRDCREARAELAGAAILQDHSASVPPPTRAPAIRSTGQLFTILLMSVYFLNLGYGFDGTGKPLKSFTFVSRTLTGSNLPGARGNRFAGSWLGGLPVPVPEQYLLGMDIQRLDFEDYPQPSYLRGEWRAGGWWYYYLYGLAVKTPHGTQLLLLLAWLTLIFNGWQHGDRVSVPIGRHSVRNCTTRDVVVLLLPAMTVLLLVSSQLEFNQHFRYVLPTLGFAFVFGGATIRWL